MEVVTMLRGFKRKREYIWKRARSPNRRKRKSGSTRPLCTTKTLTILDPSRRASPNHPTWSSSRRSSSLPRRSSGWVTRGHGQEGRKEFPRRWQPRSARVPPLLLVRNCQRAPASATSLRRYRGQPILCKWASRRGGHGRDSNGGRPRNTNISRNQLRWRLSGRPTQLL